jgi:hypothetical protein
VGSALNFSDQKVPVKVVEEKEKKIQLKARLLAFIQTRDFKDVSEVAMKSHINAANRALSFFDIVDLLRASDYKMYNFLVERKREFSGFNTFPAIQQAITTITLELDVNAPNREAALRELELLEVSKQETRGSPRFK